MKLSSQIAVTAIVVVIGAAGLLYPIQESISDLEFEIQSLNDSAVEADDVQQQIVTMHERIAAAESALEERTLFLCPDSSSARLQFEASLTSGLVGSGLERVSIDRTDGSPVHGIPTFVVELVVEGNATQLHAFLRGLEGLPWVNRVIHLQVHPGLGRRTVEMKIAVPLESDL